MKSRKKIIIIEVIFISFVLLIGVTYSLFTSNIELENSNQEIAQFIFNANETNLIEIPLNSLIPGDNKEYNFSVSNNLDANKTDVTVEYQITLRTLHSIPLAYQLSNSTETLLTCDINSTRNTDGLMECTTPVMQMSHDVNKQDDYKLNVIFPSIYNDHSYANLVDFIEIEIDSWQKIE